jgi:hypothetical protein
MPTYDVTLIRAYRVRIKARSKTIAKRASEFFLLDPPDGSQDEPKMRKLYGFHIEGIEMVDNDAIKAEIVE